MIARVTGAIALLLHVATAWRYGYFRDELYFIVCSKHPAWGYVDQPPLVAVASMLAAPFDYALEPLRALPMLSSTLAAVIAALIARDLGGGRFAQWTAGLCVALMPAYLILGNTLTTTSFESCTWCAIVWACIRIVRGGGRRWWFFLSVVAAVAIYGKYSVILLLAALAAGLLLTRERSVLRTWYLPAAAALTALLVLPNALWQALHGWPILDVLHGDTTGRHAFSTGASLEYRDAGKNFIIFTLLQFVYTNVVAATIWIVGLAATFRRPYLRDMRWLAVGYFVLFAATAVLDGKGYYIIGIYGPLIAMGAVAVEAYRPLWRNALVIAAAVVALCVMPFSLPVLSASQLVALSQVAGITGRDGQPAHFLQPLFAEEFGWPELTAVVARVYTGLPPRQRASATIYSDTYADAGAIDRYGPKYRLPLPISSQNNYWLWGTHGQSGDPLIVAGGDHVPVLMQHYRACRLAAISQTPQRWVVEAPFRIYVCTGADMPLEQLWPLLRWYGA